MQNIISLIFRYFLSLFPACAGVIQSAAHPERARRTFPRMRGGDPGMLVTIRSTLFFSPHARG